jgi:hypothetical protein
MTFIDHDEAVVRGQLSKILSTGKTLSHGDVDDPLGLVATATNLADRLRIET